MIAGGHTDARRPRQHRGGSRRDLVDGALRYPSETGSWQLGGVDLGEFLAQYRDQQVTLIIASLGAADPEVVLCGLCGFPVDAAGVCPRCALMTQEEAAATRRVVDEQRLLDKIEERLAGFGE